MVVIKSADFITSAVRKEQYPELNLPEVAFVGRSNVGKSTAINSITNRKRLARTSSTPGRTRLVNFFKINNEMVLVDLPGYGYAKISKQEKEKWGTIIEDYIGKSDYLKRFVLLVDSRHKPTEDDLIMLNYMRHFKKEIIVVGTKLDKLKRNDRKKNEKLIRETLDLRENEILILYSSVTKENIEKIIKEIFKEL